VATGSEVALALTAREQLEKAGVRTRVVSMPCREWFDEQPPQLPRQGAAADGPGSGLCRGRGARRAGARSSATPVASLRSTTSVPPPTQRTLFREFGFTPQAVVAAAKSSLKAARAGAATKAG
jgi:transketolase